MKSGLLFVFLTGIATPAFAADELVLQPPYESDSYVASYETANPWSRPYIGVFGGVGAGSFDYATTIGGLPTQLELAGGGLEGGLRVGYDYATSAFLVGAIADYAITSIRARGELAIGGFAGSLDARVSSIGTIRGRLGVTQKNNLFYFHGGAAFATVAITDGETDVAGVIDNPRLGYTLGAGYEYAISQNASFQTEYAYTDLGAFDVYSSGPTTVGEHIAFHKLASGFNIRF